MRIILSRNHRCAWDFENVAEFPLSQSTEIDINDFGVFRNLQATLALNGNCSRNIVSECIAYIVLSLDSTTIRLFAIGV